jgi:hypothetical protein
MVGVPTAGDHDAHLRRPVLDSAAQRERAVEDLDQPPREVRPQLRHAVDRTAPPARLPRRAPIETGGERTSSLALNRLAGQSQDVTAQASGIAESVRRVDGGRQPGRRSVRSWTGSCWRRCCVGRLGIGPDLEVLVWWLACVQEWTTVDGAATSTDVDATETPGPIRDQKISALGHRSEDSTRNPGMRLSVGCRDR